MTTELEIQIPIELVCQDARTELLAAAKLWEEQHPDQTEEFRTESERVLQLFLKKAQFVNFLFDTCPSLKAYFERIGKKLHVKHISVKAILFLKYRVSSNFIITANGLSSEWNGDPRYPLTEAQRDLDHGGTYGQSIVGFSQVPLAEILALIFKSLE